MSLASMLREHGTQRPSVFEILNHVHTLRGTKSRFTYSLPPRQPPLSPRTATSAPLQTLSPNIMSSSSSANPLDDLVTYKPRQSPAKNAGVEAREKVLEAIAPMRRGRPASAVLSTPPPSPRKEKSSIPLGQDAKFSADDDRVWRGVRGHKSGMATFGGGANLGSSNNNSSDAWGFNGREKAGNSSDVPKGFDNDFSSFGKGFGDSFQPSRSPLPSPKPLQFQPHSQSPRPTPSPSKPTPSPRLQPKDAFDGLGLVSAPPPPTLGEARRVRTGMANLGGTSSTDASRSTAHYLNTPSTGQGLGIGTNSTMYRPPSSHSPMPTTSSKPPRSASPQVDPWKPHGKQPSTSSRQPGELSAEERFPSLEDLDREFTSPSPVSFSKDKLTHTTSQPSSAERIAEKSHAARPSSRGPTGGLRLGNLLGSNGTGTAPSSGNRYDGVRSQQVTGAAMRESRIAASRQPSQNWTPGDYLTGGKDAPASPTRPALTRRHRSSVTIKQPQQVPPPENMFSPTSQLSPPALPPRPSASPRQEPRDWLTGASDDESQSQPVLRDSPSKRASFIEKSPVLIQKPLEAVTGEQDWPTTLELEKEFQQQQEKERKRERERDRETEREILRKAEREKNRTRAPSPTKASKAFVTRTGTGASTAGLSLPRVDTKTATQRTGGASPSGLTSNWSPIESNSRPSSPLKRGSTSSSSDDGPEDANFVTKGTHREKTKEHDGIKKGTDKPVPARGELQRRRRTRSKGRQNSVHDLVDLWGGGLDKDPNAPRAKSPDKRASVIMPAPKPSSLTKPIRTSSPQPLISMSTSNDPPLGSTSSRFIPPRPPSSHQYRKEPSNKPAPGARALPAPIPSHTSVGRSRPQSMIVSPTNRNTTIDSKNNTPFPASISSPSPQQQQSLSLPPQDARAKRSARRSSISDMVLRYEAIGSKQGPDSPPTAPTPAAKPAGLGVKVASSATGVTGTTGPSKSTSASSPSSAALRFPKLSPTNSPVLSKASLSVPEDAGQGSTSSQKNMLAKGRTSPAPSITGLPNRGSAKASDTNTTIANGLPRRTSPLLTRKPSPSVPSPEPVPASVPSPRKAVSPGEEVVRSPSPEKPYVGVSSLIDRWQRAVDGSEGSTGAGRGGAPRGLEGVCREEDDRLDKKVCYA
ncbi:hypothetical protein QCA50_002300 [Cerrena zonata]|uniref:Uncharacterized protein n=1 Tax=Cerrena zonata TaxID=2478898 RepID=A0AAW0GYQ5_9APHY